MLLARSLLFELWFYASMAVMGVLLAPAALVSAGGAHWAVRQFARQALWMLARICGLKTEIRGAPPSGAALVAAKHQSFLDVLMLAARLERPNFVMKRSLVYAPILGLYALRMGAMPVDRRDGRKSLERLRRRERERGVVAAQLVIYPQGTRVAPGATAPYRRGVGALYQQMGVACWPAAAATGRFWARNSVLRRPGLAVMRFLEPLPPGLPQAEFMREIEQRIEAASAALDAEALARSRP